MSLKALITTLVLGSSSLALAQPGYSHGVDVRDHRAPVTQSWKSWAHDRAVTLASALKLFGGRAVVNVTQPIRPVSALKLQSAQGRVKIDRVVIDLANGSRQVVRPSTIVSAANPLTIDLDGGRRNITRIAVYGSSTNRRGGSIDVIAI